MERKLSSGSASSVVTRRTSNESEKESHLTHQLTINLPIKPEIQRQSSSSNTGNGMLRQGSQGSLFEQIASQAKDLVRETTRQSSQDGLLAQMDKV